MKEGFTGALVASRSPSMRKGIWLIFQNGVFNKFGGRLCGNATRLRHSSMRTEKSRLFFLTNVHSLHPRKSFAERMGQAFGKAPLAFKSAFGPLMMLLENRRVYSF